MTTPAASPIPAHRGGAITGHIMTRREIALMDYRLGMFAAANAITLPRPRGPFDNQISYRDCEADAEVLHVRVGNSAPADMAPIETVIASEAMTRITDAGMGF